MTLNERIAKVKGLAVYSMHDGGLQTFNGYRNWEHSITDAWELVEEMGRIGITLRQNDIGHEWMCKVGPGNDVQRYASTAPEAICLAYLAVMEEDQ